MVNTRDRTASDASTNPKTTTAEKAKKTSKTVPKTETVNLPNALCGSCNEEILEQPETHQEKSMECECCMKWYHTECGKLNEMKYTAITDLDLTWYCPPCEGGAKRLKQHIQHLETEHNTFKQELRDLRTKVEETENNITENINRNLDEKIDARIDTKSATLRLELTASITEETNRIREELLLEIRSVLKDEVKNDVQIDLKADIEQEITNAANDHEADEDNTNPWIRVVSSRNPTPTPTENTPNLRDIINQELSEQKKIELLKKNLIMSGIKEQEGTEAEVNAKELRIASEVIMSELEIDAGIERVERCGKKKENKPRPLRLVIPAQQTRKDILMKAKNLRDSQVEEIKTFVFINPDLTTKQQLDSKNLRMTLAQMRAQNQNKTYKIKKGVITEVTVPVVTVPAITVPVVIVPAETPPAGID